MWRGGVSYGFTCSCPSLFDGDLCQHRVFSCADDGSGNGAADCGAGASCHDIDTGFSCQCDVEGYVGSSVTNAAAQCTRSSCGADCGEAIQTTTLVFDAAVLSAVDTTDPAALAAVADAIEAQVAASQGAAAVVVVTKVLVQAIALAVAGFSEMSTNDQATVVTVVCGGACDGRSTCACVRVVTTADRRLRGLGEDSVEVSVTDTAVSGQDLPAVVEASDLTASMTSGFAEATFEDSDLALTAEDLGEPTVEPTVALEVTIVTNPDSVASDTAYAAPTTADLLQDVSTAVEETTGEAISVSDLQSAVTSVNCRGSFSACDVSCERVFTVDMRKEGAGAACEWEDQFSTAHGCSPGAGACPAAPAEPCRVCEDGRRLGMGRHLLFGRAFTGSTGTGHLPELPCCV